MRQVVSTLCEAVPGILVGRGADINPHQGVGTRSEPMNHTRASRTATCSQPEILVAGIERYHIFLMVIMIHIHNADDKS